jgi:hypothetical protein
MPKPLKDRVMEALLKRQGQWTVSSHLARIVEAHSGPSEPTVRRAIASLIYEGVPIISCSLGYKIAETEREVEHSVKELLNRSSEIELRVGDLRNAWRLWNLGKDIQLGES